MVLLKIITKSSVISKSLPFSYFGKLFTEAAHLKREQPLFIFYKNRIYIDPRFTIFAVMTHINSVKPLLIVVTGPTASGKTLVSSEIAQHFCTEIISADSRQLFREMEIGTAIPDSDLLSKVKHHFIHSHSINDYYNASRFEEEVIQKLHELYSKVDIVVLTGGSMLYIDAVCNGIDDLPPIDLEIRNNLIARFEKEGIESLRFELKKLDPDYYHEADLQNHKRLLHALEICLMTGKPYSSFRTHTRKQRPFGIIKIGLSASREILYDRINRRVDDMVNAGLENEARRLYPYRRNNALNTVGYREWFDYFDGFSSYDETIEKIKSNTRRYARKQLTWFRRDGEVKWFDLSETGQIIPYIETRLKILWKNHHHLY